MYRYTFIIAFAIILSAVINPVYSYSEKTGASTNTLKGLKGIGVSVQGIDSEASKDGLDAAKLKKSVTQKLKHAGIKVYADVELTTIQGQPELVVNINAVKAPGPIYIFTTTLDFNQIVLLQRNTGLTAISPTWSVLSTGGSNPEDLLDNVQASVDKMLDSFIADFQKANPK